MGTPKKVPLILGNYHICLVHDIFILSAGVGLPMAGFPNLSVQVRVYKIMGLGLRTPCDFTTARCLQFFGFSFLCVSSPLLSEEFRRLSLGLLGFLNLNPNPKP